MSFGGGGSQPAQSTVEDTKTNQTPYAPAIPYLMQAMKDAANIYSQGSQKYTPWSQISGFTPEQLAAQKGITDYANSYGTQEFIGNTQNAVRNQLTGGNNQYGQLANQAGSVLTGFVGNNNLQDNANILNNFSYGDTSNPYNDAKVNSSMQELSNSFMANTLPTLRRAAIGQGTYGSSRNALAEGSALGALDAQMQSVANNVYMSDYANTENNRLGALNQIAMQQNSQATNAGNLFNQSAGNNLTNIGYGLQNYKNALAMPLDMMNQTYQVGSDIYHQKQAELSDATNRWNYEQNAPWDNISRFKQLIDPTSSLGGAGTSNSTTSQFAPKTSMTGNIMGGLLQAAPMVFGMMGGVSSATSGSIGSGFSGALSPSSMGISNASIPSAPAIGSSNFGGGIMNNTTWGMPSSFGWGG